jgi:hypothetical protein
MNFSGSLHPYLKATISGLSKPQVHAFRLRTDRDVPLSLCLLVLAGWIDTDLTDATVSVKLGYVGGDEWPLYTGYVETAFPDGSQTACILREGVRKFEFGTVEMSYHKEKADRILADILDAAGIDGRSITCPSVELPRFAVFGVSPLVAVRQLVETLGTFQDMTDTRFFFDAEGKFHFGKTSDTGKNSGPSLTLKTGSGILASQGKRIETVPLPVRHSQAITVESASKTTSGTNLRMGPGGNYLEVDCAA